MILVTGSIVATAATYDELVAISVKHVRRSRGEPGCIAHAVHRDVEQPLRLVFLEEWVDRAALAAHFEQPTSRTFVGAARALAATPPSIQIYEVTPEKV